MTFLVGAVSIIGILFMLTFMFIGIWLFIIALKAYNQLRYKNYILEKMNQKLDALYVNKGNYSYDDFLNEENSEDFNIHDLDNVKDFEKRDHK
ncbi:hypothetical protein ACFO6R_06980 [Eubacterium multiforme]|uniref:Lipopolysaccharide export LptBFGC system permease protein LptF n=1 Tax=Eubacterium multiforme TaxID=83339 RepID=A0ABT9UWG4_9FIRM|nr:hypothetical protein [Eubacterium multiforme]MDQ0150663.1 lipopolysaccharide export LptBFGC system permease protein LptF [Eubacterium multiforme]